MIDIFYNILIIFSIVALILIVAGIIASPERLREFPQRAFLIIHGIGDLIRRGCQTVLRTLYTHVKNAAHSVGISGENWVQRIVGAILLTIATIIALFVGFLNVMVSLGGVIGSASVTIIDHLPLSIEEYTAVELVVAAVIFGILLLDIIGITHLTKFYSPRNLETIPRYFLGAIFLIGAVFTVYLFAMSGVVRSEALHAAVGNNSVSSEIYSDVDDSYIYSPNDVNGPEEVRANEYENSINNLMSDEFVKTSRILLWGIPLVCVVSGIFSAVGLIPFLGMMLSIPLFLIFAIPAGMGYIISHILLTALDYIYSFILLIYSGFVSLGYSIRQLFSKDNTSSNLINEPSSATNEEETDGYQASSNITDENQADGKNESSELNDDDVWNPLK